MSKSSNIGREEITTPVYKGSGSRKQGKKVNLPIDDLFTYNRYQPQPRKLAALPKTITDSQQNRRFYAMDFAHGRFVQANYRIFVDAKSSNFFDSTQSPDKKIDWNYVLRVDIVYPDNKLMKCPICLDNDILAPRITRCGHVFCLHCMMQYLGSANQLKIQNNKEPRSRCPICFEFVSKLDLRSVRFHPVREIRENEKASFSLLCREIDSLMLMLPPIFTLYCAALRASGFKGYDNPTRADECYLSDKIISSLNNGETAITSRFSDLLLYMKRFAKTINFNSESENSHVLLTDNDIGIQFFRLGILEDFNSTLLVDLEILSSKILSLQMEKGDGDDSEIVATEEAIKLVESLISVYPFEKEIKIKRPKYMSSFVYYGENELLNAMIEFSNILSTFHTVRYQPAVNSQLIFDDSDNKEHIFDNDVNKMKDSDDFYKLCGLLNDVILECETRKSNLFCIYQLHDGQLGFLDPFLVGCLLYEYKSIYNLPLALHNVTVVGIKQISLYEPEWRRHKYFAHLATSSTVNIIEIDISKYISKETASHFKADFERRAACKVREEKKKVLAEQKVERRVNKTKNIVKKNEKNNYSSQISNDCFLTTGLENSNADEFECEGNDNLKDLFPVLDNSDLKDMGVYSSAPSFADIVSCNETINYPLLSNISNSSILLDKRQRGKRSIKLPKEDLDHGKSGSTLDYGLTLGDIISMKCNSKSR